MKIGITADLHGNLPEIEPCDLFLIAGDCTPVHDHHLAFQESWLDTNFRQWLIQLPADKIVGIAGNHDFYMQERTKNFLNMKLPWTYLERSGTTYEGLNIWGHPWVPNLPFWAFYATDITLFDIAQQIPDDTNILVTHGPPRGILDKTVPRFGGRNVGDKSLAERVVQLSRLKLHVFGHIHEARGDYKERISGPLYVNASFVDENYLTYPEGVVYLEL